MDECFWILQLPGIPYVDRSDGTRRCTSRSNASGAPLCYALNNNKPHFCKDWCSSRVDIALAKALAWNTCVLLGMETIIIAQPSRLVLRRVGLSPQTGTSGISLTRASVFTSSMKHKKNSTSSDYHQFTAFGLPGGKVWWPHEEQEWPMHRLHAAR